MNLIDPVSESAIKDERQQHHSLLDELRLRAQVVREWDLDLLRRTTSHRRLSAFLADCRANDELLRDQKELFWAAFKSIWPCCDNTWQFRNEVLTLLRSFTDLDTEDVITYADDMMYDPDEALMPINRLPDVVKAYRGCSRDRVRGLSWTTSRKVAEAFARGHRGIPVQDPVVAECDIPRHVIFTPIGNRSEYELVVDFKRLPRKIAIHVCRSAGDHDAGVN